MSATVIQLNRAHPKSAAARLTRAIALTMELRQLVAQGFGPDRGLTLGMHDRLAGEEVRLRSQLAVVGAGGDAA